MNIKGAALVVIPDYIKKYFGEDGLDKWLDELPEDVRQVYNNNLSPVEWYELNKYYLNPIQTFCDLFYDRDFKGAEELGAQDAENSLSGILKLFVKMGSPEFLVKRASTLFPTYYQGAKMEVVDSGKYFSNVRVSDFGVMKDINTHTVKGWIIRALELSGANNVKIRVENEKSEYTDFLVKWE